MNELLYLRVIREEKLIINYRLYIMNALLLMNFLGPEMMVVFFAILLLLQLSYVRIACIGSPALVVNSVVHSVLRRQELVLAQYILLVRL